MKAVQLLQVLQSSRAPTDPLSAQFDSGLYALFLVEDGSLAEYEVQPDQPIYVGASRNVAKREFDNHFNSSGTGWSTVRRSLGALLKDNLKLVARPRSRGTSPQDYYCYRFKPDGEDRLTEWMKKNIHVAVQAISLDEYQGIEVDLIATARPLLNLTGWTNPNAPKIKRLRKVCADEARGLSG